MEKVKTAAKMYFYTGSSSREVFSAVFNLVKPYFPSISYWVWPYRMHRQQKSYRKSCSKVRQYTRIINLKESYLIRMDFF